MHSSKRLIRFVTTGALATILSVGAASALYAGETTASSLNIRSAPGGSVISSVPRGTKIAVISNSTEWYEIAVNGQTAYASGAYVNWVPDCDFAVGTGVVTAGSSVNLRSAPSTDGGVVASLANGTSVQVVGISQGWYKVTANGQTGYMHADYVRVSGGVQTNRTGAVGSTAASSNGTRQAILDYAAKFLGTPYVYGGSTPSGFDCSGFTSYVYKNIATPIARTSSQQRNTVKNISMGELLPGDLVFFGSNGNVSHVGIYTGNGQFIHSPHTGSVVKYDTLSSGNYNRRFIAGGRVLD